VGSRAVHAVALGLVAAATFLGWGVLDHPIVGDRAYFVYLGQAVLRGEPIYADTFMGYPPLGPLLAAAAMALGRIVDCPTYLSPRALGVLVTAASALLLHRVASRATLQAWPGLCAALVLLGFGHLGRLTVSNLEPKVLLVAFELAVVFFLQRRRHAPAGVAAGLAATCWQPGVWIAAAALPVLLRGRRRARALAAFVAGGVLGGLPACIYLTVTQTWGAFLQRSFVIPATLQTPARDPLHWLRVVRADFPNETLLFAAAAAGFCGFVLGRLRRGPLALLRGLCHGRLGGLPLLALVWIAWNSVDFQGPPDLLPLLPPVAFFAAWGAHRAVALATRRLGGEAGRAVAAAPACLVAATGVFALGHAALYHPATTLAQQKALVDRIVAAAGPAGRVLAFDAEEVYVLAERPSPNRFLRLNRSFLPFLHWIEPEGCAGVWRRTVQERPEVVVIRAWYKQGECVLRIEQGLRQAGYTMHVAKLHVTQRASFHPERHVLVHRTWRIYQRTGAAGSYSR
jgi:hypothetical protein